MILVTGATGTVGGELVRQLVDDCQPVRVFVRDARKAAVIAGQVEVAVGDLDQPETLRRQWSTRRMRDLSQGQVNDHPLLVVASGRTICEDGRNGTRRRDLTPSPSPYSRRGEEYLKEWRRTARRAWGLTPLRPHSAPT